MKHLTTLITILFIALLSSPSWSQTVSMDDLVERNNLYFEKFTDVPFSGKVTGQWNGNYKDGKPDGLWEKYSVDGELEEKGSYKDGIRLGRWTLYYREQGGVEFLGIFNGGFNSGMIAKATGSYNDSKKDGLWEYYRWNGKVLYKETYKDGLKDGLYEEFYENGQIKAKGSYVLGEKNGLWKTFLGDGEIWEKGLYKNGEKRGTWEYFNKETDFKRDKFLNISKDEFYTKTLKEKTLKDGVIERVSSSYHNSTGVLASREIFKDDVKSGIWVSYWDDGQLREKGNYKDGIKDGLWETYHPYGNIIVEKGNWDWGIKDGYWIEWQAIPEEGEQGNYRDGFKDGRWEKYFESYSENGKRWKIEISNFQNGFLEGDHETYYHRTDKLRYKGNYKGGRKEGLWEYFNEDGSLTRTETYKDGKLVE